MSGERFGIPRRARSPLMIATILLLTAVVGCGENGEDLPSSVTPDDGDGDGLLNAFDDNPTVPLTVSNEALDTILGQVDDLSGFERIEGQSYTTTDLISYMQDETGDVTNKLSDRDEDGMVLGLEKILGTSTIVSDEKIEGLNDGIIDLADLRFLVEGNDASDIGDNDADIDEEVMVSLEFENGLILDPNGDDDGDLVSNIDEVNQHSGINLSDTDGDGHNDYDDADPTFYDFDIDTYLVPDWGNGQSTRVIKNTELNGSVIPIQIKIPLANTSNEGNLWIREQGDFYNFIPISTQGKGFPVLIVDALNFSEDSDVHMNESVLKFVIEDLIANDPALSEGFPDSIINIDFNRHGNSEGQAFEEFHNHASLSAHRSPVEDELVYVAIDTESLGELFGEVITNFKELVLSEMDTNQQEIDLSEMDTNQQEIDLSEMDSYHQELFLHLIATGFTVDDLSTRDIKEINEIYFSAGLIQEFYENWVGNATANQPGGFDFVDFRDMNFPLGYPGDLTNVVNYSVPGNSEQLLGQFEYEEYKSLFVTQKYTQMMLAGKIPTILTID